MTLFATGNNLIVKGDMVRRTLVAQLDTDLEQPELRGSRITRSIASWPTEASTSRLSSLSYGGTSPPASRIKVLIHSRASMLGLG